ncbi:hypothetical protein CFR79_03130 [Komagataeibacter saccharivorans]|uniref:hypothetical protein n=1 Tax=Komagataeibacter saccharivorans TaxID=265959 RepID=UPI000D7CE5D9|nr:hypothetical protein [Komagataeibacter saccharivorans]PYD51530.1 hypothetical protein CFR79_03130 [Komagataeibacter saccharivorans]
MSGSGSEDRVEGNGQAPAGERPQDIERVLQSFGVEQGFVYRPFSDPAFQPPDGPPAIAPPSSHEEEGPAETEDPYDWQGDSEPGENEPAEEPEMRDGPEEPEEPEEHDEGEDGPEDVTAEETPEHGDHALPAIGTDVPPEPAHDDRPPAPAIAHEAPPPPAVEEPALPPPEAAVAPEPPALPEPEPHETQASPLPAIESPPVEAHEPAPAPPVEEPVPTPALQPARRNAKVDRWPRALPPYKEPMSSPQKHALELPLSFPEETGEEDWMPVPKARHQRGERPRPASRSLVFSLNRPPDERRLFSSVPVRVSRPQHSKVKSMTKSNSNPNSETVSTPSADGSPTMSEMFMILGGRATERLTPKSTLRDALLRRREEEES